MKSQTKSALASARYYTKDPERARAKARAWYAANKEKCIAMSKRYYRKNKPKLNAGRKLRYKTTATVEKAGCKAYYIKQRDKYLRSKYGITEATYHEMLAEGNGACWICKRKPKPGKNLNVDHEHLTKAQKKAGMKFGKVRGLLDFFCNKYLIGRRKTEHAVLFERAAAYLRSKKDWRTDAVQKYRGCQKAR